jgi:hypothetical protein
MKKTYLVHAVQTLGEFGRLLTHSELRVWSFNTKKEAKEWCATFKKRPAYARAWVEVKQ